MNKKGISAIIATVLVILITAAAVTIVWTMILPMVNEGFDIEGYEVNLVIEVDGGYTYFDYDDGVACVQIKRLGGDANLSRIDVLFSYNGTTLEDKGNFSGDELPTGNELKQKCFNLSVFNDSAGNYVAPSSIKVVPVYSDGNEVVVGGGSSTVGGTSGSIPSGNYGGGGGGGGGVLDSIGDGTTNPVCVESWSCEDWGDCILDNRTRICSDANSCGTIADRPDLNESCVPDVSIVCGDGACDVSENCSTCFVDCGECFPDSVCDENSESCLFNPTDCGVCACGDGTCDASSGESVNSCWVDCGFGSCGDGSCSGGEDESTCSEDCGDYYEDIFYDSFGDWVDYSGTFKGNAGNTREFLVSPSFDAGSGNEQIHHWINVNYTATSGGTVKVILGYYSSDNMNSMMSSSWGPIGDVAVASGEEVYIVSQEKRKTVSWVVLEVDDDVTLENVSHKAMVVNGGIYGHKAKEYKFANSYLPYRILYPRNYNSSKSYPLIVVGSGSEGVGNNNAGQMEGVTFSRYYFTRYYFDSDFEAFVINVQIPSNRLDVSQIPSPFYPRGVRGGNIYFYHSDWPTVNKDGFYAEGVVSLVGDMIDNPNMNVDSNKVYYAGFSYSGKAAYEVAREAPDLWAAIWAVEGWPIYYPYRNIDALSEDDRILLLTRLAEEVATYKDIPFLVSVGSSGMNYSSYHACEEIKSQGGDCVYEFFPGIAHTSVPSRTFGKVSNVEWLFDQVKG